MLLARGAWWQQLRVVLNLQPKKRRKLSEFEAFLATTQPARVSKAYQFAPRVNPYVLQEPDVV